MMGFLRSQATSLLIFCLGLQNLDGLLAIATIENTALQTDYDVTTIYRFPRKTSGVQSITNSSGPTDHFIAIQDCEAENTCDWSKEGWRKLNTAEVGIHAPDYINLKTPKLNKIIFETLDPLWFEKGILVSASELFKISDELHLYFSSGEDTTVADMYIIVIKYSHIGYLSTVTLYECKQYESMTADFEDIPRKCSKVSDEGSFRFDSSELPHVNIRGNIEGKLEVSLPDRPPMQFDRSDVRNYLHFGVNFTRQEIKFQVSRGVNVYALERLHGEIKRDIYWPAHISEGLCISVEYYLEPDSNARIDVKAVLRNDTALLLGSAISNEENIWKTQIFYRDQDSTVDISSIKIIAKKYYVSNLFIKNIRKCNSKDDNVLASIHRESSIEIHARNNALGLPFMSQDRKDILDSDVDFESCTAMEDDCEWDLTNFTIIKDSPPLHLARSFALFIGSGDRTTFRTFHGNIPIRFSSKPKTGQFILYLTEHNGALEGRMYKIFISYERRVLLQKCYGFQSCTTYYDTSISESSWEVNPFEVVLEIRNGDIKLTNKEATWIDRYDGSPFNIQYYSVELDSTNGHIMIRQDDQTSLSLTSQSGSIISPFFIPGYNKICISIVSSGLDSSYKLQMVKMNGGSIDLTRKQKSSLGNNWTLSIYHGEIIEEKLHSPISIKLSATSNLDHDLRIQRIASCNGKELDKDILVHIVSSSTDVTVMNFQSYEVSINSSFLQQQEKQESKTFIDTKYCDNGGLLDKKSGNCICPAGFMGATCEIGCGADRYASKCDGRCSRTKMGCMGMKLCRPTLGCSCAPGIKGILCDASCSQGEYGAGCKQKCGNCADSGRCDKYTGSCSSGCQEGFYPPNCQWSYKYMKIAPEIKAIDFNTLKVTYNIDPEDMVGKGKPRFHQLQIKENAITHGEWKELIPVLISNEDTIETNITNLMPNIGYQIRIILLDKDGNSYQGPNVPVAESFTKCLIPNEVFYDLSSLAVTEDEFKIQWQYDDNITWCKLSHFEVYINIGWKWQLYHNGVEKNCTFYNMLPGETYEVRVRAVTSNGPVDFSKPLSINTRDEAPGTVTGLQIQSETHNELVVEWTEPFVQRGKIQSYKVEYKCIKLLACSEEDCSGSKGQVEVITTSTTLHGLHPHAQYIINVSAKAAIYGNSTYLIATTAMAVPDVAPTAASSAVISSNTSVSVHWESPKDCTLLNGYLHGYQYELYAPNGYTPIQEGQTVKTSATFYGLNPHTQYKVKVYLNTSGGRNRNNPLVIDASTRATVPGPVQQLTAYKTGYQMIGLRWAKPRETYGDIRSFTISYRTKDQQKATNVIIKPTSCKAWPNLFCYTIINTLRRDTEYFVTVQARNVEVQEDGEEAQITTITKDYAPLAPSYLQAISQTETNLTIEWGLPRMVNGVLRSFLVNMEETDAHNTSSCCEHFPVEEIPVRFEKASYQKHFHNLKPASTYTISVTAKTSSFGPAMSLTTHTRPSVPSMEGILEFSDKSGEEILSTPAVIVRSVKENKELVTGYLLVVIPESSDVSIEETSFQNDWLEDELKKRINGSFYVAAELNQANLEEQAELVLGTGNEVKNGQWSELRDPILEDGKKYRFGLVMILSYCGVLNVGYIETDPLTVNS